MSYKKSIVTIMTLMILVLLMMTTTIQAASLTKVTNLTGDFNGSSIILRWNSVSGADGYGIFEDGRCIGYISDNAAGLIGYKENTTYYLKVAAYTERNGTKTFGPYSTEISVKTTVTETLGTVTGFNATQINGQVSLNWSSVSKATKYQIFADIPDFGSIMIGEVPTTGAIISNCVNKEKYTFKVRACQELSNGTTKYGDVSASRTITINSNVTDDDDYYDRLGQVKGLTVSDVTKNSAYLDWDEVSYADGYEIRVARGSSNYYDYYDYTTKEYYKLTGLDENTSYKVKVVAYEKINGDKVYGTESSYRSFTTLKQQTTLSQVKGLTVSDVTESSAYLDWDEVSYADGYEIRVAIGSSNYYDYYDYTTREYYKLTGLDENTSYKVKVVAYEKINGDKVYGAESSYRSFKTLKDEEYNKPAQVKGLDYDVNGNEVTLTWTKVNDADGYDIFFAKGNATLKYKDTTTNRKITFTGLDYNTTYRVQVRAYKNVNKTEVPGDLSTIKSFTTDSNKLGNVQHLSATVQHRNEAYLQWWPLDGADGYNIYVSEGNGTNFKKYDTVDENTTILYDLDYNTNYQVRVKAYRWNGSSKEGSASYSNTVSFRTEKSSYYENDTDVGTVRGLNAYVVKDTVTLTWNKVSGASQYQIEFTVPGIGGVCTFYTTDTSRFISGLTEKEYQYTARVRAYNPRTNTWGPYSEIVKFAGK